jgi:transcriptional regulator with XRE-family HTH domain
MEGVTMSILGKRIGEMRRKRGLTQRQLADKLKVSHGRISLYETGDRSPDPEMLNKLADFFGCSVDYLLGRSDDPDPISKDETDIKKILEQKEKAHWDGRELTVEEKEYLSRLIQVAIQRDKGTTDRK